MDLKLLFDDFNKWSKSNNILLIQGVVNSKKGTEILLEDNSENSLEQIKSVIKNLNINLIIYNVFIADNVDSQIRSLKNINNQESILKINQLEKYNNKFLGFEINFLKDGVIFSHQSLSDDSSEYENLESEVSKFITESFRLAIRSTPLSDDQITEFGQLLAINEKFEKIKIRSQREKLAKQLFLEKLNSINAEIDDNIYNIVLEAEEYFNSVLKPQKETELKLKINNLIKEGISKTKIAAQLEISIDTVNKLLTI